MADTQKRAKRQQRFKKIRVGSLIKEYRELILNKLLGALIVIVSLIAGLIIINALIYNSDYFRLKIVETKGAFVDVGLASATSNELLKLYKGRNVFTLNLKGIARSLEAPFPDAREIRVNIGLPDKLLVSLKFRKPIALVNDKKYYPIDEEGCVLPSVASKSLSDLPVIMGVNIKAEGRRGTSRNMRLAIELLREIKKSKLLKDYGVNIIDAGDSSNMRFYLKNGLEIRVGSENFGPRIAALETTLKNPRLVIDAIKYIDVRFEDVIIGPKE